MNITIEHEGDMIIARLAGRLDTAAAVEITPTIQDLAEQADKHIILDCMELQYISSSGLRLFLTLRKESAAKGGKLQVRNINADIRQVFMMTGFISLFEILGWKDLTYIAKSCLRTTAKPSRHCSRCRRW